MSRLYHVATAVDAFAGLTIAICVVMVLNAYTGTLFS